MRECYHSAHGKLNLETETDVDQHQPERQQHGQPTLLTQFITHLWSDKFHTLHRNFLRCRTPQDLNHSGAFGIGVANG